MQIAIILFRAELDESLREIEALLNSMTPVLDELGIDSSPDHTTICRWERKFDMQQLRSLLRRSAEQAGWTGIGAIDAGGFQRDQTSPHYRNRANYSLQKMKTMTLVDMNTLAIENVHSTTRKSWDGHIGMQVLRRNVEDLRVLTADKNYSWSELYEECRAHSTRPVIKHKEHNGLKKAHDARIDDDVYHQRWTSESGSKSLKIDSGRVSGFRLSTDTIHRSRRPHIGLRSTGVSRFSHGRAVGQLPSELRRYRGSCT